MTHGALSFRSRDYQQNPPHSRHHSGREQSDDAHHCSLDILSDIQWHIVSKAMYVARCLTARAKKVSQNDYEREVMGKRTETKDISYVLGV